MSQSLAQYDASHSHIPSLATRERVKACVFAGMKPHTIASILDIHIDTLKKYYPNELKNGLYMPLVNVANTALGMALEGNVAMIQLILKTRGSELGWTEKNVLEVGLSPELEQLSEQLARLEQSNEREY